MNTAHMLSQIIRQRRSARQFLATPIPKALLDSVLADANHAPSWSNTQPHPIAIADGVLRDQLQAELTRRFDKAMAAQRAGKRSKSRTNTSLFAVFPSVSQVRFRLTPTSLDGPGRGEMAELVIRVTRATR